MNDFSGEMQEAKQLAHQALAALQRIQEITIKQSKLKEATAVTASKEAAASENLCKNAMNVTKKANAERAAQKKRSIADKLTKEACDVNLIADKTSSAVEAVRTTSILLDALIPCKEDIESTEYRDRSRSPLRGINNRNSAHEQSIKGSSMASRSSSQQPIFVSSDDELSGDRNQDKSGVIQLFIRSWTGKTLDISISRKASVAQLKEHIQQQEGFPPDQQILVHAEDEKTLDVYNIFKEATLFLRLKLRGD
jgi:large subunit ribosomal protein L40e